MAIHAATLRVTELRLTYYHVPVEAVESFANLRQYPYPAEKRSYPLTDATVSLQTDSAVAAVGVHPLVGDVSTSGSLKFKPEENGHLALRSELGHTAPPTYSQLLAAGDPHRADGPREFPEYDVRVDAPVLSLTLDGPVHYKGGGAVILLGMDVLIQAQENTTSHRLVPRPREGVEQELRWLFLEFQDADIHLDSTDPVYALSPSLSIQAARQLSVPDAEGSLQMDQIEYSVKGREVLLRGDFAVDAEAIFTHGQATAQIQTSGSIVWTNLMPSDGTSTMSLLTLTPIALAATAAAGVALVGGAYVTGVAIQRRRAHQLLDARVSPATLDELAKPAPIFPLLPEDCLAAATYMMLEDQWGPCVEWLERAKRMVPTSTEVLMNLAYARSETGDVEGACQAFEEAWEVSQNPWPLLLEAAFLMRVEGASDKAFLILERALRCEPNLVAEVEDDPVFETLRDWPGYRSLIWWAQDHYDPDKSLDPPL